MSNNKLFYAKTFSYLFFLLVLIIISSFNIIFASEKVFTIKEVTITEKSDGVTGNITSNTDSEINNDIVFHKLNDYVIYKLIILNNTDENITIESINDDSDDQYVEYQYEDYKDKIINSNGTLELDVKAIYKNEQKNINNREYTSNVKFTIEYKDENENGSSIITINPKTSDNIFICFILLVMSVVGSVVFFVYYNKLKNKDISKSVMMIFIMIILVPAIVKAATYTVEVFLKTNYSLYDKVVVTYVIDDNETTLINGYGNTITGLDEPSKENYNFIGWIYEDGSDFDISKPITKDIKIIAKFEKKHSSIIFNNNANDSSVSGEMDNQTVYCGEESNISSNMFTRAGYRFTGWNTEPDGSGTHYNDSDLINLTTEDDINLYAEWIELTSMLLNGEDFHDLLSELNNDLTEFKKSAAEPNLDSITYKVISTADSNFPVYVWNDNGIIYWWSEAEKVYMDSNCNYMFYAFRKLTNVDFTGLDSSQVTTMDFMFQYCSSLTTMDLRLDTSNVVSMDAMFANCTGLESIDFSHINTSKVENYHGLVAGCSKLANINLNNFHTEGAKNFESMFSTLPNLTEIDLSSFSTPKLESIYFMFLRCNNLTTIYATDQIDLTNINDSRGALSYSTKIVGGAGTTYTAATASNVSYFRIDDPDNGKPGYLTLKNARYIRYDGNGSDGGDAMTSHYLTNTTPGNLKTNTYEKTGQTFVKWNTMPDGSGDSYIDGQLMDTLEPSKTPLTLYAIWE